MLFKENEAVLLHCSSAYLMLAASWPVRAPAMSLGTTGAQRSSLETDNRTGQPAERKLTFRCGSSRYLGVGICTAKSQGFEEG